MGELLPRSSEKDSTEKKKSDQAGKGRLRLATEPRITDRVKGRDYPGDKNGMCGCGIFEDFREDEEKNSSMLTTKSLSPTQEN